MLNWEILKNPANWIVVWTMLIIGWLGFRIVQRGIPAASDN
jgi:hypothetical protein